MHGLTSTSILEHVAPADWGRSGTHGESGHYSVETWLEIYAAHCHDHADQIARAVEESRDKSASTTGGAGETVAGSPATGGARVAKGAGTKDDPWQLTTPSGTSNYEMYRDETLDPPALVCTVGTTQLRYQLRCLDDVHQMLKERGDWVPLGSADEQKPAADGTVEAWGRSADNPVGGWYGLKKGLRGRFGMYVPPLMEALGLAEVEHNPRNNRMRAL